MNAAARRARKRAQDAVKRAREGAARIASIDEQLAAAHARIERLDDDLAKALRQRDDALATVRAAQQVKERDLVELRRLRAELAAALSELGLEREARRMAQARAEEWREKANVWEADAKRAQKLQRRLDRISEERRLAPAHRKAVTPGGGQRL